jgi:hypothetical protein
VRPAVACGAAELEKHGAQQAAALDTPALAPPPLQHTAAAHRYTLAGALAARRLRIARLRCGVVVEVVESLVKRLEDRQRC